MGKKVPLLETTSLGGAGSTSSQNITSPTSVRNYNYQRLKLFLIIHLFFSVLLQLITIREHLNKHEDILEYQPQVQLHDQLQKQVLVHTVEVTHICVTHPQVRRITIRLAMCHLIYVVLNMKPHYIDTAKVVRLDLILKKLVY